MKEFDTKIEELRKLYNEKPFDTINCINEILFKLKFCNSDIILNKPSKTKPLILGAFIVIILLLGLTNMKYGNTNIILYYFGALFFIAGLFVTLYVKRSGIIFLFTHGCPGLGLMNIPKVIAILKSPIITDGNDVIWQLFFAFFILMAAIVLTMYYCRNDKFQKKRISLPLILLLYLVGTSIIQFIPVFYNITINSAI